MIYAYPLSAAVNSYQTHKDYFRVSAVRGVAAGKSSTIHGSLNLPFEGSSYQQFVQTATRKAAGFVQPAQKVGLFLPSLTEERPADNNRETGIPHSLYSSKLQAYMPFRQTGLLLDAQF